jgi:hypothetical protein
VINISKNKILRILFFAGIVIFIGALNLLSILYDPESKDLSEQKWIFSVVVSSLIPVMMSLWGIFKRQWNLSKCFFKKNKDSNICFLVNSFIFATIFLVLISISLELLSNYELVGWLYDLYRSSALQLPILTVLVSILCFKVMDGVEGKSS